MQQLKSKPVSQLGVGDTCFTIMKHLMHLPFWSWSSFFANTDRIPEKLHLVSSDKCLWPSKVPSAGGIFLFGRPPRPSLKSIGLPIQREPELFLSKSLSWLFASHYCWNVKWSFTSTPRTPSLSFPSIPQGKLYIFLLENVCESLAWKPSTCCEHW
jgi:hypothetical protein